MSSTSVIRQRRSSSGSGSNYCCISAQALVSIVAPIAIAIVILISCVADVAEAGAINSSQVRFLRSTSDHHSMMHSHLSRKVFDRACAASKDTIDEIIACLHNNEGLMKSIKVDVAQACYKESFGQDFNAKDAIKHKELICNNREKFETMTACVYHKTSEQSNKEQMDKLAETLVDVGMCIINALDG